MTYAELPQPVPDTPIGDAGARMIARQPILYCPSCGGEFSANPGDYWQQDRDAEITCDCTADDGDFRQPLELVWKRTILVPYADQARFDRLLRAFFGDDDKAGDDA